MSETETNETTAAKEKKAPPEVKQVAMEDGRTVAFVGKRRMIKETAQADNQVTTRFDFINGTTRSITVGLDDPLVLKFIGHGIEQKVGDETAGDKEVDDMVLHVDAILQRLAKGEWGIERGASDGFAGASVVVKALVNVTGKTVAEVKAFLEAKLEAGKAGGLTRQKLYQAFRGSSKIGEEIQRLEAEKAQKDVGLDGDAALAELTGDAAA